MSASPRSQSENHILNSLPPEDYERLAPHLETVELTHAQVLYDAEESINYLYFPLKSMVSLISHTVGGESIEVGVVGYEGIVGISRLLGVDRSAHENLVQVHDGAVRAKAHVIIEEFKRGSAFQGLTLRYMQSLLLQISQVVACNQLHTVSERLARWLLMCEDRCQCSDLPLTQEFLSLMLGTRRATVTEAAIVLQAEGYIKYRRGHIQITDRAGLEDFSCDCYQLIKTEFDNLLEGK